MDIIVTKENSDISLFQRFVEGQYKLRHRELIVKNCWENICGDKEHERDQFDTLQTEHIIAIDREGRVVGVLSVNPTTKPYMLQKTFSYLLSDNPPVDEKIFEASRLVLDRDILNKEQRKSVVESLLLALMEIGLQRGIDAYIGFMLPKIWDSTFLRCGWDIQWVGEEKPLEKTGEIVRAAMMPVNKTIERKMRQIVGRHKPILDFETCLKQIVPISVERFMALAVEHYYATRDPFGVDGDFTTAPEISQMFGELIGIWAANEWVALGRPNSFILLECGPGRGTLMADALRATKNIEGFHAALSVVLMENSPILRTKQRGILAAYSPTWAENLDDPVLQSSNIPIILLANEFLDALPIRQFQKTAEGWQERMVGMNKEGRLEFQNAQNSSQFSFPNEKDGTIIEISPARENFVRDVCALLKKNKGAALFIDYGHLESGIGDTLQAVKGHKFIPVLGNIGAADLTSHVDFAALRRVADENGIHCRALTTQEDFLRGLGIEHRAAALMKNATAEQQQDIQAALHRLTSPKEMGELFKVMVLSHVSHG